MAEIIDDRDFGSYSTNSRGGGDKWVGIVELPANVNSMLRGEKIINIRSGLEREDWVIVNDEPAGENAHVFVFQLSNGQNITMPEKPEWDWEKVIQPYRSLALGPEREVNIQDYQ